MDVQERVVSYLEEEYFVSREKAVLAYQVARREQELLSRLDCRNGFSLYAGIPFCPVCVPTVLSVLRLWRSGKTGWMLTWMP